MTVAKEGKHSWAQHKPFTSRDFSIVPELGFSNVPSMNNHTLLPLHHNSQHSTSSMHFLSTTVALVWYEFDMWSQFISRGWRSRMWRLE